MAQNGGYICRLSSDGIIDRLFNSENTEFFIKFHVNEGSIKKGTVLCFSQTTPLTIGSKCNVKVPNGDAYDKYFCEYDGEKIYTK